MGNISRRGIDSTDNVRVLVVADDPLSRAGLAAMLTDEPGYELVGQTDSANGLADALDVYGPDVVVWDLGWDSATGGLGDLGPDDPPVVALLPDETAATEAWSAGARGLVLRSVDGSGLLAAVRAASAGMIVVGPELAVGLLSDPARPSPPEAGALSPRELDVLKLLAEGLPNKEIAHRLEISEHTVKFHVNSILSKLGAQSRTDAVVRATRLGLVLI